MQNRTLRGAGLLFALMAIIHLARLYFPFQIIIGQFHIPQCASIIAYLAMGLLSAAMFLATASIEELP